MKITIDLAGATPTQLDKFSDAHLPKTLEDLRTAVGDAKADIEVRKPGGMRLHVVQTLDDFNAAARNLAVRPN